MNPDRYLYHAIRDDALAKNKMAFVSGPRQVGKTTLSLSFLESEENFFSYENDVFRRTWLKDAISAVAKRGSGPILLDEIHKDRFWKRRIKGLYDSRKDRLPIIVTGSARLDLYRRGGDSLLGRYLPYRMHPFTVGERSVPPSPDETLQFDAKPRFSWETLLKLGGFPEPFFTQKENEAMRWSRLRMERLLAEDVRDLKSISNLRLLEDLCALLPERIGALLSINNLREILGTAHGTVKSWLEVLAALYVTFEIRPFTGKLSRMVRSEPKLYLYDILAINDIGVRAENLMALHLLKSCHYWTDLAYGDFSLHFVRNKDSEEVDFLVLRDRKPWILIECKSSDVTPSPTLRKFAKLLDTAANFQITTTKGYDRFLPEDNIRVINYEKFLAAFV